MNIRMNYAPLSATEKAILYGSLLGDGCLVKRGNSYRYKIEQGEEQKTYVDWKYEKLGRLCQTTQPPKKVTSKKGFVSYLFYTSSGLYLKELYDLYYEKKSDGKYVKTITQQLIDSLPMDPIVLAVLFMDDGSVRNDCYAGKIATQCFSLEEQHLLSDYLKKWGIDCNIVKHNKEQFYISIPAKSFGRLAEIIEPTVLEIPVMSYKLNKSRRPK
jgi:hypothetical protein